MQIKNLLPDQIRYIDLYGVRYYIVWEDVHPGCSFFLKTTASPAVVRRTIRRHQDALGITLKVQARYEKGYYGVRVWRTDKPFRS